VRRCIYNESKDISRRGCSWLGAVTTIPNIPTNTTALSILLRLTLPQSAYSKRLDVQVARGSPNVKTIKRGQMTLVNCSYGPPYQRMWWHRAPVEMCPIKYKTLCMAHSNGYIKSSSLALFLGFVQNTLVFQRSHLPGYDLSLYSPRQMRHGNILRKRFK
jgi:hypothetical protein